MRPVSGQPAAFTGLLWVDVRPVHPGEHHQPPEGVVAGRTSIAGRERRAAVGAGSWAPGNGRKRPLTHIYRGLCALLTHGY